MRFSNKIFLMLIVIGNANFSLHAAQAQPTPEPWAATIANTTSGQAERKRKTERIAHTQVRQSSFTEGKLQRSSNSSIVILDYYYTNPRKLSFALIENDTHAAVVIEQVITFPLIFSFFLSDGTTGYHECNEKCTPEIRHHPFQPTPTEGKLIENVRLLAKENKMDNPGCFSKWKINAQGNVHLLKKATKDHAVELDALEKKMLQEQKAANEKPANRPSTPPLSPKKASVGILKFLLLPPRYDEGD